MHNETLNFYVEYKLQYLLGLSKSLIRSSASEYAPFTNSGKLLLIFNIKANTPT